MMMSEVDCKTSSLLPASNCRPTAGYSGKSESAKLMLRRKMKRTKIRRLRVLSSEKSADVGREGGFSQRGQIENGDSSLSKGSTSVAAAPVSLPETTVVVKNESFSYQSISVIGRHRQMEDAVTVELGFVNDNSKKFDFFGVYDGHGSWQVAHACREQLHKVLAAEMADKNGITEEMNWEDLMVESFTKMDSEVNETDIVGSMGSTAVVAVVGENELVIANCGDSRAVLSRGGISVPLSVDHKPDRPDELARIEDLGGKVINWNGYRVSGILAISRSIGDKQLKPYVIAKPEVIVNKRHNIDEFLILASDGLWDVISNDYACHVVRKCLDGRIRRQPQHDIDTEEENRCTTTDAAMILTEMAFVRGSKDNISVVVINLNNTKI